MPLPNSRRPGYDNVTYTSGEEEMLLPNNLSLGDIGITITPYVEEMSSDSLINLNAAVLVPGIAQMLWTLHGGDESTCMCCQTFVLMNDKTYFTHNGVHLFYSY